MENDFCKSVASASPYFLQILDLMAKPKKNAVLAPDMVLCAAEQQDPVWQKQVKGSSCKQCIHQMWADKKLQLCKELWVTTSYLRGSWI